MEGKTDCDIDCHYWETPDMNVHLEHYLNGKSVYADVLGVNLRMMLYSKMIQKRTQEVNLIWCCDQRR